uniref:Uncharacterized protein n=1 Tax=Rhizophora mucronata TaxID=61149 RepID=A0A2P2QNH9_RHIMU
MKIACGTTFNTFSIGKSTSKNHWI